MLCSVRQETIQRFTSQPDKAQEQIQQKLWQLIYREACEWPPGSGGIADTPPGL